MDEPSFCRAVTRISHEILERNKGTDDVVLLGILRRGVPLSVMIRENIYKIEGVQLPCGELDIKYYRDDLTRDHINPEVKKPQLPFDINGKRVILVDDVMYTGRTVRAAIEAVFSVGRPDSIQLAILIDRGHRELPFKADYVGKNVPTSKSEVISVCVPEYDDCRCVRLLQMEE